MPAPFIPLSAIATMIVSCYLVFFSPDAHGLQERAQERLNPRGGTESAHPGHHAHFKPNKNPGKANQAFLRLTGGHDSLPASGGDVPERA
jgi:hypothetical protein